MQSLPLNFSSPQLGVVYWHDHIGLCCLLKATEFTSLDSYSLAVLRPRKNNPHAYDISLRDVFILPMDRGTDLIEVPHTNFVSQEAIKDIAAKTLVAGIASEAFKLERPYFIFNDAAFAAIEEMKLREKLPNYSRRDPSDFYTASAEFADEAQVALTRLEELRDIAQQGGDVDSDDFLAATSKLLENLGETLDARKRASDRNLDKK